VQAPPIALQRPRTEIRWVDGLRMATGLRTLLDASVAAQKANTAETRSTEAGSKR